jgi:hypothetical protein
MLPGAWEEPLELAEGRAGHGEPGVIRPTGPLTTLPGSSVLPLTMSVSEPWIPVAASDLAALRRDVGPVTPLPGTKNNNALLVEPGDQRRQLWVRPEYQGYRDAWKRVFIYIPPDMQVDHIYNRGAALAVGYQYVRLFLCPSAVNMQHGSKVEGRLTRMGWPAGALTPPPPVATARYHQIAKMCRQPLVTGHVARTQEAGLEWLVDENFI